MSKELEVLSRVQCEIIDGFPTGNLWVGMTPEELEQIKSSIQRLEAIDNAKPSEALKELEELRDYLLRDRINISSTKYYNTIKQALLKAQEQEKENAEYKEVLRIIFEKNVNMPNLAIAVHNNSLRLYNGSIPDTLKIFRLTKEEFNLLKRYCDGEKD